jgi:membrane-associated protease RseP (regulator of RpoE activity)
MWWIILWILAFIVLVVLHEFWHFTAAKKSWVKVKEFWLWLPPKVTTLWKDKTWTEYTLNWIPLGWFVQLKWEDWADNEENSDPDSFIKAKMWKKLIIVLAWVIMNCITAWVLFTISFTAGMKPMWVLPDWYLWLYSESYVSPSISFLQKQWFISWEVVDWDIIVTSVIWWWVADKLWFQTWTVIKSINWIEISQKNLAETLESISNTTGNAIAYSLSWDTAVNQAEFDCWDDCKLWIVYNTTAWDFEVLEIKYPFHKAMLAAFHEIKAEWDFTMDNLARIWSLIVDWKWTQAINSLSWPVAIVKVWQVMFENLWFVSFLAFVWMISMALAIMNVLPLPALDWWRFWAIIIQKLFRIKEEKFSIV